MLHWLERCFTSECNVLTASYVWQCPNRNKYNSKVKGSTEPISLVTWTEDRMRVPR